MSKKTMVSTGLLLLIACFISFKFGSAPAVKAQSGLPTAPATWTLTGPSTLAWGQLVSVTKPAGGPGVKHVTTCVNAWAYYYYGNGGLIPLPLELELLDGSTILQEWYVPITTIYGNTNTVFSWSQCDLNITGSPNTAMTLKIASQQTNGEEIVNLVGYEGQ
jgi:hypothetical protein